MKSFHILLSIKVQLENLNEQLKSKNLELKNLAQGLSLCHPDFSPLTIDFLSNQFQYRTSHGALGELVAKSCGAKSQPLIWDLTAGLGRDAYLLASLGCSVVMFERNAVMFALLQDGLKRLKNEREINLNLNYGDSMACLKKANDHQTPDVIYIDPMHPVRSKSALVKKEMRILREMVGEDLDKLDLIEAALESKVKRVVVKWPLKAVLDIQKKPTASLKGKTTRFDIFQLR